MRMCPISTFPLWKAVAVSSAGREVLQAVEARLPLQRSWVTPARGSHFWRTPRTLCTKKKTMAKCAWTARNSLQHIKLWLQVNDA